MGERCLFGVYVDLNLMDLIVQVVIIIGFTYFRSGANEVHKHNLKR